jgi:hypothetical protein
MKPKNMFILNETKNKDLKD